ncbi:hypothetical protein [Thalassolituus marinus]|uniref:C2H2-type domain-containing protein n=1 Tax=Thalassolituus marinus TaxID=671053 RepID=A0ABS7ZMN3_9GAMM|nr:hypothetical protein [Thalassolituus marinus]MCA6062967.1 hypothetical protein [Thalassolituus marinus]
MNIDSLREIIPLNESDYCEECHKENLRGWTNSNELETKLPKIAEIESLNSNGFEIYKKGVENPFSFEATAALSYYPYNGSSVYQCSSCKGIILICLETGGHSARHQARWIPSSIRLEP